MKLNEILGKNFIISELSCKDKQGILHELTAFLENKGVIKNKEALFNSLMEREKLSSTGIGENVAIPHAKSDEVDHIIVVFAVSAEGVDFESLDQKPVHFVCLLLAPTNSTGLHLKALAHISRLLKSESLRDGILRTKDTDKIYSILLEENSRFI